MPSLPPTPLADIDTLPDGAAILSDDEIDASAEENELPLRRNFDEEPTRKAHAPKPPKTHVETTDVVDVSSWDSAFVNKKQSGTDEN